jgi:hypothetical protein
MPKLKIHQEQHERRDPNDTQLFTAKELASKLKVSKRSLQRLRIQGGGPKFFKVNKNKCSNVLYDWNDVVIYLESMKRISTSDTGDN